MPEIEIRDIHYLQKQRKIADPEHPKQKAVILDILVEDVDGNLYDFEMRHISNFKVLLCYLSLYV